MLTFHICSLECTTHKHTHGLRVGKVKGTLHWQGLLTCIHAHTFAKLIIGYRDNWIEEMSKTKNSLKCTPSHTWNWKIMSLSHSESIEFQYEYQYAASETWRQLYKLSLKPLELWSWFIKHECDLHLAEYHTFFFIEYKYFNSKINAGSWDMDNDDADDDTEKLTRRWFPQSGPVIWALVNGFGFHCERSGLSGIDQHTCQLWLNANVCLS